MTYTVLWIVWLIVLGGSFGVVEFFALRNDMPGDTLSEHVRKWFSVKTKIGRTIFLGLWLFFCAWFLVHILTSLT